MCGLGLSKLIYLPQQEEVLKELKWQETNKKKKIDDHQHENGSCILLLNNFLLTTYYVPNTLLGTEESVENQVNVVWSLPAWSLQSIR